MSRIVSFSSFMRHLTSYGACGSLMEYDHGGRGLESVRNDLNREQKLTIMGIGGYRGFCLAGIC
jgi:hypothetical protein